MCWENVGLFSSILLPQNCFSISQQEHLSFASRSPRRLWFCRRWNYFALNADRSLDESNEFVEKVSAHVMAGVLVCRQEVHWSLLSWMSSLHSPQFWLPIDIRQRFDDTSIENSPDANTVGTIVDEYMLCVLICFSARTALEFLLFFPFTRFEDWVHAISVARIFCSTHCWRKRMCWNDNNCPYIQMRWRIRQ